MTIHVGGIYFSTPSITITQLASDFTFADGVRGIAFDGTYWYHTAATGGGPNDHIVRETYPTRGSATTIYTETSSGGGGGEIRDLTTDGTDLYWIETWSNDLFMKMPVGGSTPSVIRTSTSSRNSALVWHPTDGLLYFVFEVPGSLSRSTQTLYSMDTSGGSLTSLYVSNFSTNTADDTHISHGLAPMSPSPGYLWGGKTPNGSTGSPGMFIYPLGGSVTIGMRTGGNSTFGPVGLKSDTCLYRYGPGGFGSSDYHIQEAVPALTRSLWPLEDPAMTSSLVSSWSAHSNDFSLTHFGAGGHIWEISAP